MRSLEYRKTFTVSSSFEGLKTCQDFAQEILKEFKLSAEKEFAFQIVLMEVVTNAIIHGNKLNEELIANISISIYDNQIEIEVEDQGNGFDLENIPSPIDKKNIPLETGRGIFFIKKFSKSVKTKGRGNIVDIIIDL